MFGEGKVAIVTGIGPGMGRSIALGLARNGVDVALAARRVERLEAVADEVRALGREPVVVPTDITDPAACRRLVDATVEQFGGVDFFVQNGHHEGDWTMAANADLDSWRQVFEVNFFGTLQLAQAVVPIMRERGGGSMVFVNSGAALMNPPTMGSYSASKAAMANLVRTMARENGRDGIRVNGVFLGAIQGETLVHASGLASKMAGVSPEEWLAGKVNEMPLGFVPTPDQVAGSILFLCSEWAEPVTGQHFGVNAGQFTT